MADNSLLEKVLGLQAKYDALQAQLSDPEVISDMKKIGRASCRERVCLSV